MSDQRVQELLRELRERYAVLVAPMPSPVILNHMRSIASLLRASKLHGSGELALEIESWLISAGCTVGRQLWSGARCGCVSDPRGVTGARCFREHGHLDECSFLEATGD